MNFEIAKNLTNVKLVLVDCPESLREILDARFIKYVNVENELSEDIKDSLRGGDVTLIVGDISEYKNFGMGLSILGSAKELKNDCLYIVPQTEFQPSTPYKDYGTSFGNNIDTLRGNCPVYAIDMIHEKTWETVANVTIQMYEMFSRKNVVKDYSDAVDVKTLSKIIRIQNEYKGHQLVTNRTGHASGKGCGKIAAGNAINAIMATRDIEQQYPDWVVVQVIHNLSKDADIQSDWRGIDSEWVHALKEIRKKLNSNVLIYMQIKLNETEQPIQSIDVSIIAPSRSNGLAKWKEPLYKTLIDLKDEVLFSQNSENEVKQLNEKLEAINADLKRHEQQLAKMLSMVCHNLGPQINMLWEYIEYPNHNQIFRDAINNMSLLLDMARKASSNPDIIRKAMTLEASGEENVAQLVDDAVDAAVINLLAERSINAISQHYYHYAIAESIIQSDVSMAAWTESYGKIKIDLQKEWSKSFREEASSNMEAWLNTHFGGISVQIDIPELKMIKHGVRYGVLLSILIELIINAIKYSSGGSISKAIEIIVTGEDDNYRFTVTNSTDHNFGGSQKGSGRGHDFINLILDNLKTNSLIVDQYNGGYRVSFSISELLLQGSR